MILPLHKILCVYTKFSLLYMLLLGVISLIIYGIVCDVDDCVWFYFIF